MRARITRLWMLFRPFPCFLLRFLTALFPPLPLVTSQAYFSYDAHKSGGVTVSHLRFGPHPIAAPYLVSQADYLAVNHQSYLAKYDCLAGLKQGGIVVLNTHFNTLEGIDKFLPERVKKDLAAKQAQLYLIDALAVAKLMGLGKHVNMVMQAVFFQLSGVLPMDRAIALLKKSITKAYERKGPEVRRSGLALSGWLLC